MRIKGIDVMWRISTVGSKEFSTTDHSTLTTGHKKEWGRRTPVEYFNSVKRESRRELNS